MTENVAVFPVLVWSLDESTNGRKVKFLFDGQIKKLKQSMYNNECLLAHLHSCNLHISLRIIILIDTK